MCFPFLFILIFLLPAPEHKTGLQPWHCKGKFKLSPRAKTKANNSFSFSAMSFFLDVYFTHLLAMQLLWQDLFSGENGFFLPWFYAFSKLFLQIFLGLPHGFICICVYIYIRSGFIFNQPGLCSFSTSYFEPDAFLFIKACFCSTV